MQGRLSPLFETFLESADRREGDANLQRSLALPLIAIVIRAGRQPPSRLCRAAIRVTVPTQIVALYGCDRDPEGFGLCGGFCLWKHLAEAIPNTRSASTKITTYGNGLEDRGAGQVSCLYPLGDLREDPGHAARQLRRIPTHQELRDPAKRGSLAPLHHLLR